MCLYFFFVNIILSLQSKKKEEWLKLVYLTNVITWRGFGNTNKKRIQKLKEIGDRQKKRERRKRRKKKKKKKKEKEKQDRKSVV